jgi:CheY-like chemotaxis protein
MGLVMPGMDGVEATRKVKNLIGLPEQPLLCLLILYAGGLAVYSPVLVGIFVTKRTLSDQSST